MTKMETVIEMDNIESYSKTNVVFKARLLSKVYNNKTEDYELKPLKDKLLKFYDMDDKPLKSSKEGKTVDLESLTDSDGYVECIYRKDDVGSYNLKVKFSEDSDYLKTETEFILNTVPSIKTYIEYIGDNNCFINEVLHLKVKIYYLDENDQKHYLKDRTVRFKTNFKLIEEVSMDSDGVATLVYPANHTGNIGFHFISYKKDLWEIYDQCDKVKFITVNSSPDERLMEDKLRKVLDKKVLQMGVIGSCVSRMTLTSKINGNYKDFFNVNIDVQHTSMISMVQSPVDYNPDDLVILPEDKHNQSISRCIGYDLSKGFFDELKQKDMDYLLIDFEIEVNRNIILATTREDKQFIMTNNPDLNRTKFFNELKDMKNIDIKENTEEYFNLWKESFDTIYNRIKEIKPNIKIIIVPVKQVYKYKGEDGTIEVDKNHESICNIQNPLLKKLENYVVDNYDVTLLEQPEVMGDLNHTWGKHRVHYTDEFFNDIYYQLLNIAYNDNMPIQSSNQNEGILTNLKNSFSKLLKR